MIAKKASSKASLFFLLFMLLSFGTGFILVTAMGDSTENRSKATGYDPYTLDQGEYCVIANSSNPNSCNHCEYGVAGDEAATEGQRRQCAVRDPWKDCMSWDSQNNCVDTYETYKAKMSSDWRCKRLYIGFGMCPYGQVEFPPNP